MKCDRHKPCIELNIGRNERVLVCKGCWDEMIVVVMADLERRRRNGRSKSEAVLERTSKKI